MDRYDRITMLLRQGRTADAARLRAANPPDRLPRWTAGNPLSPDLRQIHELRDSLHGTHLDAGHAWAFSSDIIFRIARSDGHVHRTPLQTIPGDGYRRDAVFTAGTVTAIDDTRVYVWDMTTGRLLLATDPDDIPGPAGDLVSLAVGAGTAVTGTRAGYLLHWDLTDGRLLARTAAHTGFVHLVAIGTTGTPAVVSSGGDYVDDQTVHFHHLDGLRPLGTAQPIAQSITAAGWTVLDGQPRAVTLDDDGLLTVWEIPAAAPLWRVTIGGGSVGKHLVFTPDGTRMVVGSHGLTLHVVDVRDGTRHGTARTDFTTRIEHVAVHGSTAFAVQGLHSGGRTNLLDLTDRPAPDPGHHPRLLTATTDGQDTLVALDTHGLVHRYATHDGQPLAAPAGTPTGRYQAVGGHPHLATVTVSGRTQLVVMTDLVPTVVDPVTGATRTATADRLPDRSILWGLAAHDGLIAAVTIGGTVAVWDATTLTLRASTSVAETGRATDVALADRHGRTVVLVGFTDGSIRWYDGTDLTALTPPGPLAARAHPTGVTTDPADILGAHAVRALHVTGTTLLTAVGTTVTIDDLATGDPAGPALPHPSTVTDLCPAAGHGVPAVATTCADGTLRIWELRTGQLIRTFPLHPDTRRVLSVTGDQVVTLAVEYLLAVGDNARNTETGETDDRL
ncbi:WD40 repeat domain-containing protein [Actinoplanes awajinensis]|uniref:WD40 repeat domain-containing protein n=1 Tax=Actinoplanes awajinensis subsp. mycoplanecinus TaxID=135947 RepID=A0A101JQ22_9ACTN|nr:WD40 repeat domain-containing protein [Actinoplanes awajinensis]KUL30848.1 hypothetical protein ADL15_23075 [Actinoplanes awajinensis subsp. mycoplanecinus]